MATTHQKVEQGARSREALLNAAIELIADGGYTATGVDAIARRSGVVKSALYWHFGSKDGLLIAVLKRTAREWVGGVRGGGGGGGRAGAAPREIRFSTCAISSTNGPSGYRLILSALIERGPENEEVREGVARILSVMRDAIARGMSVLPMPPERVHGLGDARAPGADGRVLRILLQPGPGAARATAQSHPQDARAVRRVRDQAHEPGTTRAPERLTLARSPWRQKCHWTDTEQ